MAVHNMHCTSVWADLEADALHAVQDVKKGGGNIFDKIGSWFSDRKDDAGSAADKAKGKAERATK